MPDLDSFEGELLAGVAALIASNPAARVRATWRPDGTGYLASELGIYRDRYPEGVDSITLAEFPVSDDPSLSDSVVGLQVTIKARDRGVVRAITSDVFDLLAGRWGGMLGGVRLVSATRSSGTPMGQDSSERQGRQENYYLSVWRPSPNRT